MTDEPADPFDFTDPRFDDWPGATRQVAEIREAMQLTAALGDIASLEGLVHSLRSASRRDLELVARLAVGADVHRVLIDAAEAAGFGRAVGEETWRRWIVGPATTEGLSDLLERVEAEIGAEAVETLDFDQVLQALLRLNGESIRVTMQRGQGVATVPIMAVIHAKLASVEQQDAQLLALQRLPAADEAITLNLVDGRQQRVALLSIPRSLFRSARVVHDEEEARDALWLDVGLLRLIIQPDDAGVRL